jgi:hypothetical protein
MKTKSRSLVMREMRADLHFYQLQVRVDIRALKASIRKCKEIGAKMRELQEENRKKGKKKVTTYLTHKEGES